MKKIMFNDKYGLTQAVLERRKTMTRRIATALNHPNVCDISEWGIDEKGKAMLLVTYDTGLQEVVYPRFQIGEVVAISQPYETFMSDHELCVRGLLTSAAAHNSMFVKASWMPHRIRITDIKVERLQDISDEDCIREGIVQDYDGVDSYSFNEPAKLRFSGKDVFRRCTYAETPKAAFAALIDRISGKGTWERNPWVFAYSFELVK